MESTQDTTFEVNVTRPTIIEACPEARTILVSIGIYKVVRYQSKPVKVPKYFLFNPEIDKLEIRSTMEWVGEPANFTLSSNPTFRADLSAITRLSLPARHFDGTVHWALDTIDSMTSLKSLTIWERNADKDLVRPYRVLLAFGLCHHAEISPIFEDEKGDIIGGTLAMARLRSLVCHDRGEQRILDLWEAVIRPTRISTYFPRIIVLDISYWPTEHSGKPGVKNFVSPAHGGNFDRRVLCG